MRSICHTHSHEGLSTIYYHGPCTILRMRELRPEQYVLNRGRLGLNLERIVEAWVTCQINDIIRENKAVARDSRCGSCLCKRYLESQSAVYIHRKLITFQHYKSKNITYLYHINTRTLCECSLADYVYVRGQKRG